MAVTGGRVGRFRSKMFVIVSVIASVIVFVIYDKKPFRPAKRYTLASYVLLQLAFVFAEGTKLARHM